LDDYIFEYLIRMVRTRIKIVVFDFDGILVDSVEKSKSIIINVAKKHGQKIKMSNLNQYNGLRWPDLFPLLGEKLNWSKELTDLIQEESTKEALNTSFLVPDYLLARIKKLKKQNLKVGILTNRTFSSLESASVLSGINLDLFDFIGTADNLNHCKPSPRVWDDLQKKGEIQCIEHVLFIGDSRTDLLSAKHEMFPIIFFGVNDRQEFSEEELSNYCLFKDANSAVDFIFSCKAEKKLEEMPVSEN